MNEKRLLVVVDMQNDFVTGALGTKEAEDIVPRLAEKVKDYPYVFFTHDTHDEDYLSTQEGKRLPVPHCVYGTRGHKLVDPLLVFASTRPSMDFFKTTFGSIQLAEYIRRGFEDGNINEVELVGVCTDICVLSNAILIKAFCPEITVIVDASCCAGVTPESHMTALAAMKMCQIDIINEVIAVD